MATAERSEVWAAAPETSPVVAVRGKPARALHRIADVRRQQGTSLRSVARQLGEDIRVLRSQESEQSDLKLSDLYRWQEALDVPVADLLVDSSGPLSRPVMERAKLLRVMKTAAAILEKAESTGARRMAEMLVEQLIDLMPELKGVSAWHTVGQRRSLDELGAVAERTIPDHYLGRHGE